MSQRAWFGRSKKGFGEGLGKQVAGSGSGRGLGKVQVRSFGIRQRPWKGKRMAAGERSGVRTSTGSMGQKGRNS